MPEQANRVTVSTYVPADQRDRWREDAEALDMSQSEFLRAMVQAGRRGFDLAGSEPAPSETGVDGSNPGGNDLKTAILDLLDREGQLGWTDLVDELLGDLEDDIESELITLQEEGRIQHSPRNGTYTLSEGPDGE